MGHGKGLATGLTPMQKAYAEARVRGLGKSDAAREANAKVPHVFAHRCEHNSSVQAYMLAMREAAHAVAERIHPGQTSVSALAIADTSVSAVADLAESLGHASRIMRSNVTAEAIKPDGSVDIDVLRNAPRGVLKKYRATADVRRDPEGKQGDTRIVETVAFEAESTLAAAQLLIRHHDQMDAPKQSWVDARTQIALIVKDGSARDLLAKLADKVGGSDQR